MVTKPAIKIRNGAGIRRPGEIIGGTLGRILCNRGGCVAVPVSEQRKLLQHSGGVCAFPG